MIHYTAL